MQTPHTRPVLVYYNGFHAVVILLSGTQTHVDFNPVIDEPTLRLDHVSLRYKRSQAVLEDVNLVLEPGSFSFLTGPSGAGKSALLQLIYLLVKPTSGTITIFGDRVFNQSRNELAKLRQRIGIVFQNLEFLDHLTVAQNAALRLRAKGRKAKSYTDDVEEMLVSVGLGKYIGAFPSQLSAGERQRLGIACALVSGPDLLIADEPTGNIDPALATKLLDLYIDLNEQLGTTVLFATHNTNLIGDTDRNVYHLEKGRLSGETLDSENAS